MHATIRKLLAILKMETDVSRQHDLAFDIADLMMRYLAVMAIAAYRSKGAQDTKVNRILQNELPMPSMGSWKNFIGLLLNTKAENLPEYFFREFLSPLGKQNRSLNEAAGTVGWIE